MIALLKRIVTPQEEQQPEWTPEQESQFRLTLARVKVKCKLVSGEIHVRPLDMSKFKEQLAKSGLDQLDPVKEAINYMTADKDRFLRFVK